MPFTTPFTAIAFQKFLSSDWNTYIRDNLNFLKTETPDWASLSRTTADFVKNANTTLSDVIGLSFSIAASEVWILWCSLYVKSAAAAGLKLQFTTPSGATGRWGAMIGNSQANNPIASSISPGTSGGEEFEVVTGLIVNSTTAGSVQLQAAQKTSNASNTTIRTNSHIFAARIA